jgi:hypothetical protein
MVYILFEIQSAGFYASIFEDTRKIFWFLKKTEWSSHVLFSKSKIFLLDQKDAAKNNRDGDPYGNRTRAATVKG